MDKSIDLGKAFTHMFEDSDWVTKALLGSVISIVPILNFAAIGYELQVVRNVSKGEPRPMPAWDDLGAFFIDGLQLGIARIALALPAVLVMLLVIGSFILIPLLAAVFIPDPDSANADRMIGIVIGLWLLLFFGGLLIAMAFSFIIGFVLPAMTANFARRGTFAACFEARAILDFIRRNFSNYLMVWLAGILAGLGFAAVYMFVAFIPCIGSLLAFPLTMAAIFYIYMVNGHALGQAIALDKVIEAPAVVEGAS